MSKPVIAIASDHAGFELKASLIEVLKNYAAEVIDLGATNKTDSVDYSDYGHVLAETLIEGKADKGVAICGSGIGISIAANRHKGIRAALCHNAQQAELARQHNDANILCLGARVINLATAEACVKQFFTTGFEGGRHVKRVEKLGMMMQTILITGGAGFIGSNIAAKLCERGTHRVVICDTLGNGNKWRNLRNHPVYEIIPPNNLFYWLEMYEDSLDAIIHMGAISSTTETDVDKILDSNQTLSTLLFRWCAENAKRFIYASSAATYGDGAQGFDDDASLAHLSTLRPLNPYGWSKHLVDRYIARAITLGETVPPQWAGLKFFNVYGANEYHKEGQRSVVTLKFPDAHSGKPVTLFKSYRKDYADGGQMRDFVYIKDCVNVVMWLLDNPQVSGLYNLGTGKARSFDDLARALFVALGKEPKIEYFDMPETLRDKYQYFTESRMERLRQAGYTAEFTSLEDGIRDYVQNYLLNEEQYL